MNEKRQQNDQPIITEDSPFIVKVKLLSNEVYEFQTTPEILISDFKKIIEEKVKVPVDKQRLVFSGKQLVDSTKLKDYVKESGLTIHLIAKLQPPPQPQSQSNQSISPPTQSVPPSTTSSQPQQASTQPQSQQQNARVPIMQQVPPGVFNFQNILSAVMGRPPQEINQGLNQMLGSMGNMGNMGNIQIRMVSGPIGPIQNQPNQQENQPINPNTQPQQGQSARQRPNQQNNNIPSQTGPQQNINLNQNDRVINFTSIGQLQATINRLNLPPQQIPAQLNTRDQILLYLRRLQNEMLRFIPQLNRGIQLLQEGRVTHLQQFVPVFHSLNTANTIAIEGIQRFTLQNQNQQQQERQSSPQSNSVNAQNNSNQGNAQNNPIQGNPQNVQSSQVPQVSTPPIGNPNNSPQSLNSQQNRTSIESSSNLLGGLIGPNSGFNFANIFGQNRPQQSQQPINKPPQQKKPSQPLNSSVEAEKSESVANKPPITSQNSSSAQSLQSQSLNAANLTQQLNSIVIPVSGDDQGNSGGGINLMQLFSSLQQNGGIGEMLQMSLGDMVEEADMDPIYRHVFKVISGSEIIAVFTRKNFSFFTTKRAQFREAFIKALASAGSRADLVTRYSQDFCLLMIPDTEIKSKEQCTKRLEKIATRHIQKIVSLFIDALPEVNLEVEVVAEMKCLYCQAVEELSKFCQNIQVVFEHIKVNTIKLVDKFTQGLSGLFYSIVERDLVRIYREYEEQQKRRREMSEQEAKDEADLIKQIELEASRDVEWMTTFEHSKYYPSGS